MTDAALDRARRFVRAFDGAYRAAKARTGRSAAVAAVGLALDDLARCVRGAAVVDGLGAVYIVDDGVVFDPATNTASDAVWVAYLAVLCDLSVPDVRQRLATAGL
jgi:hypothetical protein